ncbi:MAG: iron-sulfur cluster binding protein [Magnetovibrio sp.]|nr:iron-sulfur cluster binding protein [Magnetovibrio sp.]
MLPSSIPIPLPGGLHGSLPKFVPVAQQFPTDALSDIDVAIASQFAKFKNIDLTEKTVAIGVGSRGIKQIAPVVSAVVRELKEAGAKPFIVPAMGSHGGGSVEGQTAVLASYGITESAMGVPVKSSLEVVELGRIVLDVPVYCDRLAYEADHIVICNRIKPHTDYRATHESGLIKMLAIGLGKHAGAAALHFHGFSKFAELVPAAGKVILENTDILFGVALVENAEEDLRHVELVAPDDFFSRDAELLKDAASAIPRLLFDAIDVLIIDQIGKDISGAGLDPNVTGRTASGEPGFDSGPPIGRIIIRDLTEKTEGNATGIGVADVITQRVVSKMDWTKLYVNIVTAGVLDGGKLPIVADTDRDAIGIAIRGCPGVVSNQARIVRIKNTLELTMVWASEGLIAGVNSNANQTILAEAFELTFDESGVLAGSVF